MEKVGNMKFYTFDEVLDEQIGVVGTPQRDNFEKHAQITRIFTDKINNKTVTSV